MMRRDSFDATLAGWLEAEATGMAPEGLHDDAMRAAGQIRQRPSWLVALRGAVQPGSRAGIRVQPVPRYVLVILALVLLAAALALVAANWGPVTNGRIMLSRGTTGPNDEYVTIRSDGTDEVHLFEASECGQCTFWSPDGGRIMIPLVVDGRLRTAFIAPDGTHQFVLTFPGMTLNLGPGRWSPNRRDVALEGFEAATPSQVGIYIAAQDGSTIRQVTTSSDGRTHEMPLFSPDGRRIVFLAKDPAEPPVGASAGDLFIVDADGRGLRQLNPAGTKAVATYTSGRPIDWSPDGRYVVFAAIEAPLAEGRSAVYVANADGGAPVRISEWGTWISTVEWSPDGNWVVYGAIDALNAPTWIARPDGGAVRQLTGPGAPVPGCCATWSPDSTRLLFELGAVAERDLWTMDLTGKVLEQITHDPGEYTWYSWAREP